MEGAPAPPLSLVFQAFHVLHASLPCPAADVALRHVLRVRAASYLKRTPSHTLAHRIYGMWKNMPAEERQPYEVCSALLTSSRSAPWCATRNLCLRRTKRGTGRPAGAAALELALEAAACWLPAQSRAG